jgi:hypothetical protein
VLRALRARFATAPHAELASAAGEQAKITALRLDKLLAAPAPSKRISPLHRRRTPQRRTRQPARPSPRTCWTRHAARRLQASA